MRLFHARVALLAFALALSGCALPNAMPSFAATVSAARAPAPPAAVTAQLGTFGSTSPRLSGHTERDSATDQTRVSLTTHRGAYFLWVQRPRITFFYVYTGPSLEHAPPAVFLVFRTHEPQSPSTNQLALTCASEEKPQGTVPEFAFDPGAFVTDRVLTYELSLATFIDFAGCSSGAVRVGDIRVPFGERELALLRAFAGGMSGTLKDQ